ncbi:MAG: regulatory protein RecX [Pseudomonadota bacterium]
MKPRPEQAADDGAIRRAALDLLARREHGTQELARKLAARGFDGDAVADAVAALAAEGLQSDARFAEQFVWSRYQRGSGPQKIRAELRERGIGEGLIEHNIAALAEDWLALLRAVREKRFGAAVPRDLRERSRQMRFLQQRGFTAEQIGRVFRDDEG